MHDAIVHAVSGEVEIPTEKLVKALRPFAQPGFSGQVRVSLRVLPEAALCVVLDHVEATECQRVGKTPSRSPEWKSIEGREPTERELIVQKKIAENAHRFRLVAKIRAVVAHFGDGELNRFDLEMVT